MFNQIGRLRSYGAIGLILCGSVAGCSTDATPSDSTTTASAAPRTATHQPSRTKHVIRTAESDDTGDGEESWFDNADKVCADVVSTRGSAPRAQSGNLDDDMALYSAWLADSTGAAASGLSRIGSTPSRATTLIRGLRQYSELSTEAATIYAGHPVFSQRLMDIMTEQTELTTTLSLGFTLAGARACASVVDF